MFQPLSLNPCYDSLAISLDHIDSLLTIISSVDPSEFTTKTLHSYFSLTHELVQKVQSELGALSHVIGAV